MLCARAMLSQIAFDAILAQGLPGRIDLLLCSHLMLPEVSAPGVC